MIVCISQGDFIVEEFILLFLYWDILGIWYFLRILILFFGS